MLMLAVISLITITVLSVSTFFYFTSQHSTSIEAVNAYQTPYMQHLAQLLRSEMSLWIALAVITVVILGGLWKLLQLRHGGKAIAESLGGKLIDPSSREPDERKILNVIEEMAIASGNPVPPVYLLADTSINAFAAGLTRRDAVIGVTRGCVVLLNRDELQGVMAHEFSHIHNGDMRLNMRLTAILHGILVIGLIGQFILRGTTPRYHYSSRTRREGNKAQLLGLVLMGIGYTGTFFGNIIKAAVSRQREFLADASAVQFTRNPTGISGALKKIGAATGGSKLTSAAADEFSHFYFASGIKTFFGAMMATHPPLTDRIKRIEPRWAGRYPNLDETQLHSAKQNQMADASSVSSSQAAHQDGLSQFANQIADSPRSKSQKTPSSGYEELRETIDGRVGEASPESIKKAKQQVIAIPNSLHEACRSGFSARAVIYCLLLDQRSDVRDTQWRILKKNAHPATFKAMQATNNEVDSIPRELHLSLLNLCIPALKTLSPPQYHVFKKNLISLIQADKKITLFEWSLFRIIVKTIEAKDTPPKYKLNDVKESLCHLLSLVCDFSSEKIEAQKDMAYSESFSHLGISLEDRKTGLGLKQLDKSLDHLEKLKPLQKPKLLKAILSIISRDEKITTTEKELFRAIGDTLNCPIPPI